MGGKRSSSAGGSPLSAEAAAASEQANNLPDNLQAVNEDLVQLYEILRQEATSDAEVDEALQPLLASVKEDLRRCWAWRGGSVVATLILAYCLMQLTMSQKMLNVAFRHFLVTLLPGWDWTNLYYSDCIVSNPFYIPQPLLVDDCNVCESLEKIDHLANVSTTMVSEDYLKNDIPFIVTDAMDDWPVMNTDDFWFDNITELYLSEEQLGIYPCELSTNLRIRQDDLRGFLKKIHSTETRRWYGHWENCSKKGARALRQLYRRPYCIPHMVDFSDSNWVLISSGYRGKVYKQLNFETELLLLAQIRGWSSLRLVPRQPCDLYCPEVTETLVEGSIAVVTKVMWKLEYIPGEGNDNFAVAIGGFWN